MKVIHLNQADANGGAARAAYRIHHCLLDAGVNSRMWVNEETAGDWTVQGPPSKWERLTAGLRGDLGRQMRHLLKTGNPIIHSPAVLPSRWAKRINESDADIVHLHWIGAEMLSIADIGRIKKPIVWTLHDMWAFCGAEHYTEDYRWREGYRRDNRPSHESRFDLNRWAWRRKCKHWRRPMHIVTPSQWLAGCARESVLMRDWPVELVSYPMDVERWRPVGKILARELLDLPVDVPLLVFGAMGGERLPRKGFDLLTAALDHLRGQLQGLQLVVFGQLAPQETPDLGFPVHYTGHLHDDVSLRLLYSAADAFALPSRQDNLPLTCMEALACGTPVVAFDSSGPPTMIDHHKNGFLATAFDPADFARGIRWVFEHPDPPALGRAARASAEARFDPIPIAHQYQEIYNRVLSK